MTLLNWLQRKKPQRSPNLTRRRADPTTDSYVLNLLNSRPHSRHVTLVNWRQRKKPKRTPHSTRRRADSTTRGILIIIIISVLFIHSHVTFRIKLSNLLLPRKGGTIDCLQLLSTEEASTHPKPHPQTRGFSYSSNLLAVIKGEKPKPSTLNSQLSILKPKS